jgi:hypothetical protein
VALAKFDLSEIPGNEKEKAVGISNIRSILLAF